MSRSFKRALICKDANNKFYKRQASKAVRRVKDIPNGKRFKRYFCSWYISDWRFVERKFYTAEQFRRKWYDPSDREFDNERCRFRTWKEAYRLWLRGYRRK